MRVAAVLMVGSLVAGCANLGSQGEGAPADSGAVQPSATVEIRHGGLMRNAAGGVEVGVLLVNRGPAPRWAQLRMATPQGVDDCLDVVELGPGETDEAICPLRSGGVADGVYRIEVTEYFDDTLGIPLGTNAAEARFSEAELRP